MQRDARGSHVAFLVAIGALFLGAALLALGFPDRARIFPLLASTAGVLLVSLELARVWRVRRASVAPGAEDPSRATPAASELRAGLPWLLWIAGYFAAIWLLGFPAASAAFLYAFLRRVAGARRHRALLAVVPVVALLLLLNAALDVRWPEGRLPVPGWLDSER